MMKHIELLATILMMIGGINWGLVGAFNYNLVTSLLGDGTATRVIYGMVGLAAAYHVLQFMKARCAKSES